MVIGIIVESILRVNEDGCLRFGIDLFSKMKELLADFYGQPQIFRIFSQDMEAEN